MSIREAKKLVKMYPPVIIYPPQFGTDLVFLAVTNEIAGHIKKITGHKVLIHQSDGTDVPRILVAKEAHRAYQKILPDLIIK